VEGTNAFNRGMEQMEIKQIQKHNETKFNRYPWAWSVIEHLKPSKILSFGCSTGEEAVTAQVYFPDAHIHGFDTNKIVLGIAKLRYPFIHFLDAIGDHKYDLILCNSVLCNHPANQNKSENDLMSFSYFEGVVKVIDTMLKPGGYLMAMNTEYRIQDAINYMPVSGVKKFTVNLFNKKGKAIEKSNFAIWRKPI
jgi:tRNA1(Val) A37 N6-methylase TrmN6